LSASREPLRCLFAYFNNYDKIYTYLSIFKGTVSVISIYSPFLVRHEGSLEIARTVPLKKQHYWKDFVTS